MMTDGMSEGSGTIVVLIHDTDQEALRILDAATLSALRHFGIPFCVETLDAGWGAAAAEEKVCSHAAVLLPQSGTLARCSHDFTERLKRGMEEGLGLILYEAAVEALPGWVLKLFGIDPAVVRRKPFCDLITRCNGHFITWTRAPGECVHSDRHLEYAACPSPARALAGAPAGGRDHPLLVSEQEDSLMFLASLHRGRAVLFPFSAEFFTMEYLGHACGADDIWLRCIIWAARKPFLIRGMPPMAGLVIDDCSGSYNHFGYLDVINRHEWCPYLALFTETIDEVAHEDIHKAARRLHDGKTEGSIDIGFHALRYNDSFCFNHLERRPLTESELSLRFDRWDRYEREWGIRHSAWAHPHFGEIGSNAIPYYRERGIRFITYLLPLDAAWFDVPSKIEPLPPMPPFGHGGYFFAPFPGYPDMTACNCVLDRKNRTSSDYVVRTDYLWNHTPFWNEAEQPLLGESAQTLADQIRRGLDSGFYGEGATHEQRIACLRDGELEEIFQEADRLLSRYHFERRAISSIMAYQKRRSCSRLISVRIEPSGNAVSYAFDNDDAIGTELQLYKEEGDGGIQPLSFQVKSREGTLG